MDRSEEAGSRAYFGLQPEQKPDYRVSVVMPVYMAEEYLRETLDSLVAQDEASYEVILVIDGSEDASYDIALEYCRQYPNFSVLWQENQGAGAARNHGLQYAVGKYLAFLDSDDLFLPNLLSRMADYMEEYDADVSVCCYSIFDHVTGEERANMRIVRDELMSDGFDRVYHTDEIKDVIFNMFEGVPWDKMYSHKLINEYQFGFQNIPKNNDVAFVNFYLAAGKTVYFSSDVLIKHRKNLSTSLQATYLTNPTCFLDALNELEQRLVKAGLYEKYYISFENRVFFMCNHYIRLLLQTFPQNLMEILKATKEELRDHYRILEYHGPVYREDPYELCCMTAEGSVEKTAYEGLFSEYTKRGSRIDTLERQVQRLEAENQKLKKTFGGQTVSSGSTVRKAVRPRLHTAADGKKSIDILYNPAEKPLVSVIVPVYNAEDTLQECLNCIMNQTLAQIEIICVNDGSTDESLRILEENRQVDSRIRVFSQKNSYAGTARNLGMQKAEGEYLVFWDADDTYDVRALQEMYCKIRQEDSDICVCGVNSFLEDLGQEVPSKNPRGKFLPAQRPFNRYSNEKYILNFTNEAPWNKMFRRDFVARSHLQFQGRRNGNDVLFVETALCLADRISVVKMPLVCYRRNQAASLVSTLVQAPLSVLQAWSDTREYLICHDSYPERSFLNKTADVISSQIGSMNTSEAQLGAIQYIREHIIPDFGMAKKPDYFYYSPYHAEMIKRLQQQSPADFLAWFLNRRYTLSISHAAVVELKKRENAALLQQVDLLKNKASVLSEKNRTLTEACRELKIGLCETDFRNGTGSKKRTEVKQKNDG